ncbi:MAG: histidine phosphatase family protein [Acidimicrobiales bacterium]
MLIIVRHGRTEANASGLLVGSRIDPGLDDLGRRQAGALAGVLASADRVVCSPMRRTWETAETLGLPIEIDDRWIEIDYGTLDGTPLSEVPAATWASWRADPDLKLGGGESLAEVGVRVREACEELAAEAKDNDIVVVTHVSPIKAAVTWALGVDDVTIWRLYCAPASITEIATSGLAPSLRTFNVTTHVEGL